MLKTPRGVPRQEWIKPFCPDFEILNNVFKILAFSEKPHVSVKVVLNISCQGPTKNICNWHNY